MLIVSSLLLNQLVCRKMRYLSYYAFLTTMGGAHALIGSPEVARNMAYQLGHLAYLAYDLPMYYRALMYLVYYGMNRGHLALCDRIVRWIRGKVVLLGAKDVYQMTIAYNNMRRKKIAK